MFGEKAKVVYYSNWCGGGTRIISTHIARQTRVLHSTTQFATHPVCATCLCTAPCQRTASEAVHELMRLLALCLFALASGVACFDTDAACFVAPMLSRHTAVDASVAARACTPVVMAARAPVAKKKPVKVVKKTTAKAASKALRKAAPKAAPKTAAKKAPAKAAPKTAAKKAPAKAAPKTVPAKKVPVKKTGRVVPTGRGRDLKLAAYISSRKQALAKQSSANAAAQKRASKTIGKPMSRPLIELGKGYGLSALKFNLLSEKEQKRCAKSDRFF